MKFDATLAASDLRSIPKIAEQIEAFGFDGLWTSETAHNPFLPLTHAIAHTRRVDAGTGIAVAFPRSPMVMAQLAWDLAAQSEGRFILGLGTQVKAHITRRFSTAWDSPTPRLRDYILSMRAIWANWQDNKPLRYKGDFYEFTLMTPFFAPEKIAHPDIPIYIAGVNAHLCRLAGELCQGFHVHPFHTVRYLKETILPNIEQGATQAGRSRADVQTMCAIFVVTGANDAEIAANSTAIRQQIAFYASTPSYESVMDLHGWGGLAEQLNGMSRVGQWTEMAELITDDILHEFAVVAPYDQLATKVRARYDGLLDRVAYYFPFEADPSEAMAGMWHDAIAGLSDRQVAAKSSP